MTLDFVERCDAVKRDCSELELMELVEAAKLRQGGGHQAGKQFINLLGGFNDSLSCLA